MSAWVVEQRTFGELVGSIWIVVERRPDEMAACRAMAARSLRQGIHPDSLRVRKL